MAGHIEGCQRTDLKNLHESALKKISVAFIGGRAGLPGVAREKQAQTKEPSP
ncbi:hypothetical protein [Brevundimonas sp. DWR2-3-1b1]|uniref:hypothetical protein n=1 Tax=unclassified Brevundimonas TaxID=2622653 RepID=UPI003CE7841B